MVYKIDVDEERLEDALDTFDEWREKINTQLDRELDQYTEHAGEIHSDAAKSVEYLEDYTMRGGKRVRPACAIAGYKAVGGKDLNKIMPPALAIELLESYFIIHDDIYDEDDLRRGKATVHKMAEEYHDKELSEGNPKHYGTTLGILTGNIALSFAWDQIIKSDLDPKKRKKVLSKFEDINRVTNYGQVMDNTMNHRDPSKLTEQDILSMYGIKAGYYTIRGPLEMGVMIGEGSKKQKEAISEYGEKIGKAFMTYDDILGLYGNKEKTGKPVDSDLKEGKRTVIMIKALELADEKQEKKLKQALGNKDIGEEKVKEVREIVKETGAYSHTKKKLEKLIKEGKEPIRESKNLNEKSKRFLLGMADYLVTRDV